MMMMTLTMIEGGGWPHIKSKTLLLSKNQRNRLKHEYKPQQVGRIEHVEDADEVEEGAHDIDDFFSVNNDNHKYM